MTAAAVQSSTGQSAINAALRQVLQQDALSSYLDTSLTYTIPDYLQKEYKSIELALLKFKNSKDFKEERTQLQELAMKFRLLISRTLQEITNTNGLTNTVSSEQMIFIQNLTILAGRLQSYTHLIKTSGNHAKIYDRLVDAAVLHELDAQDALQYMRRNKNADKMDVQTRTDIKEVATTKRNFDMLKGIDPIVADLRLLLVNIETALVSSYLFLILYGIPGTGKTALSESIATSFSDGEFYKFDQSFFSSTYLGVTESRIRNILDTVKNNPNKRYTIIIDEADNILRQEVKQQHLNSVKIILQTEISAYDSFGPNLIIVAITNYLNDIDQTFLRRSTSIINVPPPEPSVCIELLEQMLTPRAPQFKFNPEYRNSLVLDDNLVYTNSDMGRLAKNISDNFLIQLNINETVEILLFAEEKMLFIYSSTDPLAKPSQLPNKTTPQIFTGTYITAIRGMADVLMASGKNLLGFEKYLAPNRGIMNIALANASTLTKADATKYDRKTF